MKFFRENLGLKLISVALALVLWLIVVNVSKPEIEDSCLAELHVENKDIFNADSKTWEIDRGSVTISYKVRSDQRSLISSSDFKAYIDLKDYSITGTVPVYVSVLNHSGIIQDVTPKPTVIHVRVEDVQKKHFDLVSHEQGKAATGYEIAGIQTDPSSVTVSGPISAVGQISSVGIRVDVDQLSENQSGKASPVFYDANNKALEGLKNVTVSPEEINYTVKVYKKKSVNLLSSVIGSPAAGYQYESSTVSPSSVQLSGDSKTMEGLQVLELPTVDITGAMDNVTKSFRISELLPSGVKLADQNTDAVVTIRIEKIPETKSNSSEGSTESPESTAESSSARDTMSTEQSSSSQGSTETGSAESTEESSSSQRTTRESSSSSKGHETSRTHESSSSQRGRESSSPQKTQESSSSRTQETESSSGGKEGTTAS